MTPTLQALLKLSIVIMTILTLLLEPCHVAVAAAAARRARRSGLQANAIDRCWRRDPGWRRDRGRLAGCSVGFAGKMWGNVGPRVVQYEVTDAGDETPERPRPGTLRYGATMVKGTVWITFRRDMTITLQRPLLISSFTAIDGRGSTVHISGNACFTIFKASNVIIHGLHIHHCRAQAPSTVMGPDGKVVSLGRVDGDAIRLVSASKVWIDHNTLYQCQDGLLDVTRGSSDITISNNWFRDQDKVMLLGHDDGYVRDKDMRVTVVYNRFGPNCNQRMPRIRHGYAHVVNNMYNGWTQYAIGGSMNPRVKSEANLFIAPKSGNKEVTSRMNGAGNKFFSVGDVFENGASFRQTGSGGARPSYDRMQNFPVANAKFVRRITRSAGALRCSKISRC